MKKTSADLGIDVWGRGSRWVHVKKTTFIVSKKLRFKSLKKTMGKSQKNYGFYRVCHKIYG